MLQLQGRGGGGEVGACSAAVGCCSSSLGTREAGAEAGHVVTSAGTEAVDVGHVEVMKTRSAGVISSNVEIKLSDRICLADVCCCCCCCGVVWC